MLKNNKGFSLVVLIIAILVIIIITSTAIITITSITKDRGLADFMSDLTDVRQYVVEYVGRDGTLPIKLETDVEGNIISAERDLLSVLESGEVSGDALNQIFNEDTGNYYYVDINKLGKIHLSDENRGYIINEGTLNVYVTKPFEYQGTKYYTLTSYLTGKENASNTIVPFEIVIMGNPVTWTNRAEILVSIPNVPIGEADGWNFKWLEGAHSVDDFNTTPNVNYFIYGDTITLTKNGIYTVFVENPEGKANVRKVVLTKIDDIAPEIKLDDDNNIIIDDAQTGVKNIRYKIKETANYRISQEARQKHPEYYTSADERFSDSEEDLLNKYRWGNENIKGDKLEDYLKDYQEYLEKFTEYYDIIMNEESSSGEVSNAQEALRVVNKDYPQFAYENRAFPKSERNIVLYAEDLAGNATVYSAISRADLEMLQYVTANIESLSDAKVVINNNARYTNNSELSLYLQAILAKNYFVTEERVQNPQWKNFVNDTITFPVTEEDGEKVIYAFYRDANGKIVSCYDTILLDKTPPTDDKPSIIGDVDYISVTVNQKDTKIVNGRETQSGLDGTYTIGIKETSNTNGEYEWYTKSRYIPVLTKNVSYDIVTKVVDRAGNVSQSKPAVFIEED